MTLKKLTLQKKHYLKKVMRLLFKAFSLEQLSAFYKWAGLVIFHDKVPVCVTKDKFRQNSRENIRKNVMVAAPCGHLCLLLSNITSSLLRSNSSGIFFCATNEKQNFRSEKKVVNEITSCC